MRTHHVFPIALILCVAIAVRILYYAHLPGIPSESIQWDTLDYYNFGRQMIQTKIFFHEIRTPVYSVFLNLPQLLTGTWDKQIFSKEFFDSMYVIVFIQNIVGIASLVLLYQLVLEMGGRKRYAVAFTLFIAFDVIIFFRDRVLMTESLAISWLILITYFLIKAVKKPDPIFFVVLWGLFSFGFLLRPIYIFFPFIPLLAIVIRHKKKSVLALCVITGICYWSVVQGYVWGNYRYNDYRGVSRTGDVNLFGKVLQYNLPLTSSPKHLPLRRSIEAYQQQTNEYNGWEYPKAHLGQYWNDEKNKWDPDRFDELRNFTGEVVRNNLFSFIYASVRMMPSALVEPTSSLILQPPNISVAGNLFRALFSFYEKLPYLMGILFISFPITCVMWLRKPSKDNTMLFLMGAIGFYQVAMAVFFSFIEYGRLIVPAHPQLYLFAFCWYGIIGRRTMVFLSLFQRRINKYSAI